MENLEYFLDFKFGYLKSPHPTSPESLNIGPSHGELSFFLLRIIWTFRFGCLTSSPFPELDHLMENLECFELQIWLPQITPPPRPPPPEFYLLMKNLENFWISDLAT